MDVTRVDDVFFDDAATAAMGAAFDQTRRLLRRSAPDVPELIARRIIEAAKKWRARSGPPALTSTQRISHR